jgi:PAS domain S-box-containing protein
MIATAEEHSALLNQALVTAFLENVPDLVYFKDRESRFIAISASQVRNFGCASAEQVLGKTDADFFSEAHALPAHADEQQIIRTGKPIIGKLEKETWPDGRVSWVLTSKLPLRNAEGEIIGTFGISKDVTESKQLEFDLERANKNLFDASRMAGMAEVATGVLHNVGNVLNSLNVSATVISTGLRQSKTDSFGKVTALMREHASDLGAFLTQDPKGKLVPGFLDSLAQHFSEERARLLREVESLQNNIDHIKDIVTMQQAYATAVGVLEALNPADLIEDALRMNTAALSRHEVEVVSEVQPVAPVQVEKGKVLQILINLIRNAKYACDDAHTDAKNEKVITVRVEPGSAGYARIVVSDNGIGIAPENLTRIFGHGFTTRAYGHGFGLHSAALAAKEMKGSLIACSAGLGHGATFTLTLPLAPVAG